MAVVGYARVSSLGQSLDVQLEKLAAAGCVRVYSEKVSGTSTNGREQLALMLDYVRDGDTVVITKLDRMGRSLADLLGIVNQLEAKQVSLRVLDQSLDTGSPQGRLMFQMLGAFAEFETALRNERQYEGIAKAKAEGRYRGRPKTIDDEPIREALRAGGTLGQIAKELGVSKTSVHNVAQAMKEAGKYTGRPKRPKTIDEQAIRDALLSGGKSIRAVATEIGVSKTSVHKVAVKLREAGELE